MLRPWIKRRQPAMRHGEIVAQQARGSSAGRRCRKGAGHDRAQQFRTAAVTRLPHACRAAGHGRAGRDGVRSGRRVMAGPNEVMRRVSGARRGRGQGGERGEDRRHKSENLRRKPRHQWPVADHDGFVTLQDVGIAAPRTAPRSYFFSIFSHSHFATSPGVVPVPAARRLAARMVLTSMASISGCSAAAKALSSARPGAISRMAS